VSVIFDKQSPHYTCLSIDLVKILKVMSNSTLLLAFILGTCESFFSFESNRPYTTQAVTQPSGLQAIGILYLWRTRVMCGLQNSELSTCLFQFSHKTHQTMLLYANFTPKVDFKRKFNHHQSFLYEWRLTARTIQKFRIGPSIRIESRIGRTIRNRIEASQVPVSYSCCGEWVVRIDS